MLQPHINDLHATSAEIPSHCTNLINYIFNEIKGLACLSERGSCYRKDRGSSQYEEIRTEAEPELSGAGTEAEPDLAC